MPNTALEFAEAIRLSWLEMTTPGINRSEMDIHEPHGPTQYGWFDFQTADGRKFTVIVQENAALERYVKSARG